ncbi:MAG TPA: phosphatidate cytidylyltransferase [Myxococcaceae bacterium]|nr:phosphatidate cytidylyltransferase [Myxococcaceae bacterium]
MNERNRNLVVRVVTALALLPAVLILLALGGFWTGGLVAVAAAACALEYAQLTAGQIGPAQGASILGAFVLPLLATASPRGFAGPALWVVAAVFYAAWIDALLRGRAAEAPGRTAQAVTGTVYCGAGLAPVAALRAGPDGLAWVIAALVITWANDTCAYFAGRALGRHRLYPAVSPNKTWEGFVGGFVGSVGGLFVARLVFPVLQPMDCIVLGLAGGIFGPLGDLCESMLKRAFGAKDSGVLIPGHGGILDRVDALLFNAPVVYLYLSVVRGTA